TTSRLWATRCTMSTFSLDLRRTKRAKREALRLPALLFRFNNASVFHPVPPWVLPNSLKKRRVVCEVDRVLGEIEFEFLFGLNGDDPRRGDHHGIAVEIDERSMSGRQLKPPFIKPTKNPGPIVAILIVPWRSMKERNYPRLTHRWPLKSCS